ncbi:MAG: hypothetical protein KAR45_21135 [Desulfobacteraceae bacterium]|nr:hypothetical protein [Desulfobacteraceae bacterium]
MSQFNKIIILHILVFLCLFLSSCSNTHDQNKIEAYVLKSQDIFITSSQFTEELELRKASYTYNIKDNPSEYNTIVIQIVRDLSEEIVLLHTAREKGIAISEEDFKKAEQIFLKDYPDDTFKNMLLKNAVEYSFWKKRFKNRLIIDQLIQKELREKIVIKTEDVVNFYDEYKKEGKQDLSENELIVQLREKKTEEKYSAWLDEAVAKYPVEINNEELKKFLIGLDKTK